MRTLKSYEQLCGYGCGEPWSPWAGTKLRGHARCAATPELQDDLLGLLERFPKLTFKRLSADLGISPGVLTRWVTMARSRRSAGRRAG